MLPRLDFPMLPDDLSIWLQERTPLGILPPETIAAIAPLLQSRTVAAHVTIVRQGEQPKGLYVLESGQLEGRGSSGRRQQGPTVSSLLPGALVNFQALILDQPARAEVVALSEAKLWFLPAEQFHAIAAAHGAIARVFSQSLAEELAQVASQLSYEQERTYILRPYLMTRARRGIIGRSRYAVRLRQQIKQAAATRDSVRIIGEPGLGKDNIAALVHFGSAARREAIAKVDCSTLQVSGADLFGRVGGKPGIIAALGDGTLILNNIQELDPELVPAVATLLDRGTYTPVSRPGEPPGEPQPCRARPILVAERAMPALDSLVKGTIKVPPLRVRRSDIGDQVNYYLSLIGRPKGLPKICITPVALRRLQGYDFPDNLTELENLLRRAVTQLEGCEVLTEEILWPAQSKKQRVRLNALDAAPGLRRFLRSAWYPDRFNRWVVAPAFALTLAILFLGPQTRAANIGLNVFWAWWWPVVLLGFPFVGRLWCAVCPFMIYGEFAQQLSLRWWPRSLRRWPRQWAERWGGWFLFGLFALILLWEELWDLNDTAYLSACLLLLITAGAIVCSLLFERRFWCRYLCPIGGMNGLFAKLAMTELRAEQGTCSAECTTYQCYKGGPKKGEGQETDGCPLYSHPAQLQDNRDCVLCMTCLKACPHRSVAVNLRPPAVELWTTHQPRAAEVALLLLLLDVVFLHRLPEIQAWLGWHWDLENFGLHAGVAVAALSLPAVVPMAAYGSMGALRWLGQRANPTAVAPKPRSFVELVYGYLPLVLAANLAHYLRLGLTEGGRLLPVTAATLGWSGASWPVLVAHPAVIAFLQGTTLLLGALLSMALTQQLARPAARSALTQHLGTIILSTVLWQVIVGD